MPWDLCAFLELRCLLGPAGRVSGAIGMRAYTSEFALLDDQIFVANGSPLEIAFEDFAGARRVARLCGERCPRDVRRHSVMRHGAPRMIYCRWLREPDVTGVAGELAAFERAHDRVAVADFSACRVHDISPTFHFRKHRIVEEVLGLGMQRAVDGD